ncbi:MAG: type II toxin-antitoxin system RelE/ParE family toxin [Planctomycetaceae bacterium]|nr:type II toxin-antitoxin system RelE/ParE family toxin [Planctomycetaceae bacterium]
MSSQFRFRPEVPDDIGEICRWYNERRVGLGQEFVEELYATLSRIEADPELYVTTYRDIRSVRLHRFPCVVHYRLLNDTILVLAVMHGRRDPATWQGRADLE